MNYGQIIHRTADDSYVITKNGMPYHVYPYAAEFAEEWDAVFTYAKAHPECVTEKQPYVPTLEDIKQDKKSLIDAETSAAILAGFDYAVDGATYHFSYALDDQQNFSDTANVCLMKQAGMAGLPDSVTWNAYTVPGNELARLTFGAPDFLALYSVPQHPVHGLARRDTEQPMLAVGTGRHPRMAPQLGRRVVLLGNGTLPQRL